MTAKSFKTHISEASLGRVFQLVRDKSNSFAIITAFRGENALSKNRKLNKQLEKEVRAAGFGFIKIIGHFIENQGTPDEVKVQEESLFINGGDNSSQLKGFIRKAVKKYNQDAAIFRDSDTKDGKAIFINKNGSESNLGTLTVGKVGDFMSQIAGKNKHATFVFERIEIRPNWIHALQLHTESQKPS